MARNLNIQVSSIVPMKAEFTDVRATLARWIMLGFELAMLKSRSNMDSDEGRRYLEQAGLLLPGEWVALVPGDRHTTVMFWIQVKVRQLADDGVIAHPHYSVKIFDSITSMRAKASKLQIQQRPRFSKCCQRSWFEMWFAPRHQRGWGSQPKHVSKAGYENVTPVCVCLVLQANDMMSSLDRDQPYA